MFHSQYYLVAAAIHMQSLRRYVCTYTHTHTHSSQYRDAGRAKEVKKENGTAVNAEHQEIFPRANLCMRATGSAPLH